MTSVAGAPGTSPILMVGQEAPIPIAVLASSQAVLREGPRLFPLAPAMWAQRAGRLGSRRSGTSTRVIRPDRPSGRQIPARIAPTTLSSGRVIEPMRTLSVDDRPLQALRR
jgi:hypothetical protein